MLEQAEAETRAVVAVPARGSERAHSDEHARARHNPRVDGVPQSYVNEIGATHIAYRSEPRHEGFAGILGGANGALRNGALQIEQPRAIVIGVEVICEVCVG